ncbi:endonuclease/exonuclease/phosphatase family protein [Micromonospora sp. DPT]|uniref:endonuclease/exonuclease/phosphatase family protein n=1 Tax=Micromonospora sp. DPT TaxID=3142975 RepID=UPI003207BB8D
MRYRHRTTVVTALGLVLLTDVLRVFLPSVITIFGQAASTPAELLGAFALGWFVLALAVPALLRRVGGRPVALVAAVVLAGARLAVTGFPGGRAQLWLATAGLVAGLCWLTAVAAGSNRPVPGLALGLAAAAVLHTVSDTWRSPWLGGAEVWVVGVVLAALFLAGQALPAPPAGAGGARAWLLAGPALLLAGMVALSPAVARTAMSYQFGLLGSSPAQGSGAAVAPLFGPLPIAVAVGGFLFAALTPPRRPVGRWIGPVALLAGAVLVALGRGELLLPAVLLTAVGLGGCLARCDTAEEPAPSRPAGVDEASGLHRAAGRRGYAVVGGMLVFAVAAVLYYAAYDLGYPNGWVPVAVVVLTAAVALSAGPVPARTGPVPALSAGPVPARTGPVSALSAGPVPARTGPVSALSAGPVPARTGPVSALSAGPVPARTVPSLPPVRTAAWATALALVAALTVDETLVAGNREGPPATVRVAAYNIRMGFGIEGRFDPDALARAVGRADVVVLSEVDRGWLLNGGHDTLDLLAERLDMPYVFAPAADPLWGDAVLSRWPLAAARTRRLPAVGAPTGAQALGVTVDLGADVRLAVVATHLQPTPGQEPVVQARAVASFALGYAAGRPLVVAGDMNTEPGAPGFAEFTRAGLLDALAAARPLPTSPADDPREQIDHVLVSPGLTGADVVAPRGTASDHLPVAVTLTLPPA